MRGQGRVYRPKVRGRETALWWIDYSVGRNRHRESSHTTVKADAHRLLRQRMGDRETGKVVGRPDRVTLTDLRAQLEQRYSLKGNRSLRRAKQALVHLDRVLGAARPVSELTQDVINDYLQRRVGEGAARATANYEISALTSALSQAVENRLLTVCPRFKVPKVRNARQGFFTGGDFAAVLLELRDLVLRQAVEFLHATGWRLNEVLTLTWDQIDWDGHLIRISAAEGASNGARWSVCVSAEWQAHQDVHQSLAQRLQTRGCRRQAGARPTAQRRTRLPSRGRSRRRNHEGGWLEDAVDVRPLQHHR